MKTVFVCNCGLVKLTVEQPASIPDLGWELKCDWCGTYVKPFPASVRELVES